jgi:hypothetical protein
MSPSCPKRWLTIPYRTPRFTIQYRRASRARSLHRRAWLQGRVVATAEVAASAGIAPTCAS